MEERKFNLYVIKASGERELFSIEKYRTSLVKSHVETTVIEEAIQSCLPIDRSEITTRELYTSTRQFLKNRHIESVGYYSLKHALMRLGPSGYPFEHFVADIFEKNNYSTLRGKIVQGSCITHEIDVIASTLAECIIIECKFHNAQASYSPVQTSLYFKARFDDVYNTRKERPHPFPYHTQGMIVTNTHFSHDAINFAKCSNIRLLAWGYPKDNGLEKMIEAVKLYPITCLFGLSLLQAIFLVQKNIVTCFDLLEQISIVNELNLTQSKKEQIIKQASTLCSSLPREKK